MRLAKYLFIFLVCCLTISCGLVKTAYNNAPALVIWQLDDYFDFTKAQNLIIKPSLQRLHNWHRQNQLPSYVTLLQDIQVSLANDQVSANQVCEKVKAIKLSIHTLQVESIPIITEIAPLLSDKQLNYFQKKLEQRAEKWKSDWWQETKEEQFAVRLEKAEDFAEKVYGNLNDTQLNVLKQSLAEAPINPAIGYTEIQRRNNDAFQILSELQKQSLTADEKQQLVKAGFDRLLTSPNQAYQTHANNLANYTCAIIANLHASTNSKQKLHAKNWINDYIAQFTDLQTK